MAKCKGCDAELLTDSVEILGKLVKREYCDPCIAKAKQLFKDFKKPPKGGKSC